MRILGPWEVKWRACRHGAEIHLSLKPLASHLSSCFVHQANLPHGHTLLQLCTNNPALAWLCNFPHIMVSIDSIRCPLLQKEHWARAQGSCRHMSGLLCCMSTYLCAHLSGPLFLQLFNEHSGFQKVGSWVVPQLPLWGVRPTPSIRVSCFCLCQYVDVSWETVFEKRILQLTNT